MRRQNHPRVIIPIFHLLFPRKYLWTDGHDTHNLFAPGWGTTIGF